MFLSFMLFWSTFVRRRAVHPRFSNVVEPQVNAQLRPMVDQGLMKLRITLVRLDSFPDEGRL